LSVRKRFAACASIVLVGWLLAFASHIHTPAERATGQSAPPHSCLFCSALQPGAGPVVIAAAAQPEQPEWLVPLEHISRYRAAFVALYRSRAPPVA
jgi:hypothetical protein